MKILIDDFVQEFVSFVKEDPMEAIGGLIAWISLPFLIVMLSVIGG